jgi:hypothetical protein
MKISLNQFLKLQEIFPLIYFTKDGNEINFYINSDHYYLTRYGTTWSIYKTSPYTSVCGKVIDLGTNFKTMVDNFKTWLKNMGDIS